MTLIIVAALGYLVIDFVNSTAYHMCHCLSSSINVIICLYPPKLPEESTFIDILFIGTN